MNQVKCYNANIFLYVLCHHKFVTIGVNKCFLLKWQHVLCAMMPSIIPYQFSVILFEDMEVQ